MALPRLYAFTNTHVLSSGQALQNDVYFSPDTGLITQNYTRSRPDIADQVVRIDLKGEYLVAPGFLECQINGFAGVHFTTLAKKQGGDGDDNAAALEDERKLRNVARELVKTGVTGFLATVPTVEEGRWKEILPLLQPRSFSNAATLLGAHVEGPYLALDKHGAHNSSYFHTPSETAYTSLYGTTNLRSIIKLITLAPELPGSLDLIRSLRQSYPHIVVSLGHSSSTYTTGQSALRAGARGLTHVYNAMNPLHHRDPGLIGLISNNPSSSAPKEVISSPSEHLLSSTMSVSDWLARQMGTLQNSSSSSSQPKIQNGANDDEEEEGEGAKKPEIYYSLIADKIHIHPSTLTLTYRTSPHRAILITDAIELAGLPDGTYPPNDQITRPQLKSGNRATIQGTQTLIGSCITLDECVRNLVNCSGCTLAEGVRCVTENVVGYLNDQSLAVGGDGVSGSGDWQRLFSGRGKIDIGCRADFAILDRTGHVKQTWIGGRKVFDAEDPSVGEEGEEDE